MGPLISAETIAYALKLYYLHNITACHAFCRRTSMGGEMAVNITVNSGTDVCAAA